MVSVRVLGRMTADHVGCHPLSPAGWLCVSMRCNQERCRNHEREADGRAYASAIFLSLGLRLPINWVYRVGNPGEIRGRNASAEPVPMTLATTQDSNR